MFLVSLRITFLPFLSGFNFMHPNRKVVLDFGIKQNSIEKLEAMSSRFNYEGRSINVAGMAYPPWFFGESIDNTFIPNDGTSYRFLQFMGEYLNFTWKLIDQEGDWGFTETINGTRTGLIGSILSGEAEFGVGVPTSLAVSYPFLSSSTFVQISRVTYMTLVAEPESVIGTILMPFQTSIWVLIIVMVVLLVSVAFVFERIILSNIDLKWLVFCSILQKGSNQPLPKVLSLHILVLISLWSGMILIVAYGSSIISALNDHRKVHNVDSIEEFVEMIIQDRLVPLIGHTSSYHYLFDEFKETNDMYRILSDNMVLCSTYTEAMNTMIESRLRLHRTNRVFAVMGLYKYLQIWADRLGTRYFFLEDDVQTAVFTDYYGLAFKANSTVVPHFNKGISLAREHGFLFLWFTRTKYVWDYDVSEMEKMLAEGFSEDDLGPKQVKSLNMDNVNQLFWAYLISISCDTVILALEITWKLGRLAKRIDRLKQKIRKQINMAVI